MRCLLVAFVVLATNMSNRATQRAPSTEAAQCCAIVELRQYALHPGRREELIELFDREFVDTQEATGMTLIGQFRDLDRPDAFTWIRGFPDMTARAKSLEAFYSGPVWKRHRDAANATMISSDNVRLLHPALGGSGFVVADRPPSGGSPGRPSGIVVATIYTLNAAAAKDFPGLFQNTIVPVLARHGVRPLAVFESEHSANTFPRLPVREGEHAFVWFARYDDPAAYDRSLRRFSVDPGWVDVQGELKQRLASPIEIWRLMPTARSRPFAALPQDGP